jgi:hypothetical protein
VFYMVAGHVVTMPSAAPHLPLRLMSDVELLLADTIASVRMNRRLLVCEPPSSLMACTRCQEAYDQARKVIEQAGGLPAWMEKVTRWCQHPASDILALWREGLT